MARDHVPAELDLAAPSALRDLGRVVVTLLEKWDLSREQQLMLLGLDAQDSLILSEYQHGERPLPASPEILDRVGYLLGIHRSLRLLFPENEELRFSWVRMRNQMFDGGAPIDVMLEGGTGGIARVWAVLGNQCQQ